MKRATYFLVFLFYFQSGCFGNPVPEDELTQLWVYDYHGQIEATTSGSNETVSRWTVSGKVYIYLYIYNLDSKIIFQLEDVKTSVFNGLRSDLQNVHEKEISEEAKVLLQPFVVTPGDISIDFISNEPLWSQNFKRGIATSFDLQTGISIIDEASEEEGASRKEWTIYGQCEVQYNVLSNETEIIYEKSFNHSSCEKRPLKYKSNLFSTENFDDYQSETVRTVTIRKNSDRYLLHHFESKSHLQAKILPASSYSQHLDQVIKADLVDYKKVELPIDISNITDKHEITYKFGAEPTSGRHTYDNSVEGLTKQFFDNYDTFENYFLYSPIQHIDMNSLDSIENMYLALQGLDADGFKHLEKEILDTSNNSNILEMYASLLPYVGTRASVKYLTTALLQNEWPSNEIYVTKAMAIFPTFVENYSEELLEELEPLMNTTRFNQQSARNAGPLSFASLVSHTGMSGNLKKTATNKYYNLYMQRFMAGETYQERMVYLLGLINMSEVYDLDLMHHIITNTTESRHIRTLALVGFKHLLVKYSNPAELLKIYLPIVKNKQEPFELRVQALDLVIPFILSEGLYDSKVQKLDLVEPDEVQLTNYWITTLHSLQDTTHFHDDMGKNASEALKTNKMRGLPTFATGNYRFALTDKDIGAYVQFRVITDPITNIINQIQITYKSYGYNYELNGYSLYLNIHGVFDAWYASEFLKKLQVFENVSSVPELLSVLKEHHFEAKFGDKPVHIDIVLFKHNTAVYAVHFDELNKSKMKHLADDLEQYVQPSLDIAFPLVNYVQLPSDLGTPLQFTNVGEDITYFQIKGKHIIYKSTWNYQSWIESYNPLVDTNIASYKYIGVEKALDFKFEAKRNYVSWLNKKDTFVLYTDNIMGTSVEDENILKQYCENCEAYIDVAPNCNFERISKHKVFGFKLNITEEGQENELNLMCGSSFKYELEKFFENNDYKSNFDAFPTAEPLMYLIHVLHHNMLLGNELSRASYHSLPYYDEDTVTTISIVPDVKLKPSNFNPTDRKMFDIAFKVENKIVNHKNVSSQWLGDLYFEYNAEHIDDDGEKNFAYFANFYLKYISADDDESYKICAKRGLFFPTISADKYSLKPVKPSTGKLVLTIAKNLDGKDGVCNPKKVITITDHFSASDKADKLKDEQNKKHYDECLASSKDLDYTAPTKACRKISAKLAEYDNYKAYLQVEEYPEKDEDVLKTKTYKTPVIEYSRDGTEYLKLSFNIIDFDSQESESFNNTIYYPYVYNPLAMAYYAIPFLATSKCTISPRTIEQFSGKPISNENNKWLAFAECYNVSTKGLTGHTIDDHHVGFTYQSGESVFTGTVKGGKPHFELDGKELHKTFDDKYSASALKVFFLADNVVIVVDDKVNIYYNTEYVQVKVNALYSKLLCGACTQQ